MKNTVNYEREAKILDAAEEKIDVEEILFVLQAVEKKETFMLLAGSFLYDEINKKINLKGVCRKLREEANISSTEEAVEQVLFVRIMAEMLECRNDLLAKRKEKIAQVNRMADKHSKKVARLLARYEAIEEKFKKQFN